MSEDKKNMNGSLPSMDKIQMDPAGSAEKDHQTDLEVKKVQDEEDGSSLGDSKSNVTDITDDIKHSNVSFTVERPVFNQLAFDDGYDAGERPSKTMKERCLMCKDKCECSLKCCKKKTLGFFPFIPIMKKYSIKEDLFYDLVAGLTVSVLQIPQGMAYAMLANVDPVYGLYTSFFSVIVYFFFGTCRHVNVGTFAVISLMVGSGVDKLCAGEDTGDDSDSIFTTYNPSTMLGFSSESPYTEMFNGTTSSSSDGGGSSTECNILAATAVTFLSGCVQLLLAVTRLGFVVIYLSEPMTRGFTTGAAIHVFSSQLKYIFGVEVGRYNGAWKLVYTYRDLILALPDTNWAAFVIACVSMIILWCTKEYINPIVKKYIKAPIPIELIVVILAVIGCYFGNWEEKYGLPVVGHIPTGLPPPKFPPTSMMSEVIGDAIAIAIVAFAISVSMAQVFANKHNYKIDPNQELMAHGIANVFGSTLSSYTTCVSLSRSVVQENLGGRTQVAGLFSCFILLLVLMWLAPLFEPLPDCVLGAIVIVALKGMFLQFADLKRLWYISKTDLSVWIVVFVAVVLLDVAWGLVVGVAYSLLTVVGRTQSPYCCLEGKVSDTDIYKDLKVYKSAKEVPGVKVFRFESSLYFANTRHFQSRLYHKTGCNPKKLLIAQVKVDSKHARAEEMQGKYDKQVAKSEEKGKKPPKEDVLDVIAEFGKLDRPVPSVHHIVVDCTTMGFIDSQGVSCLNSVVKDYKAVDVKVLLAGCKAGIRQMLEQGGFYEKSKRSVLFPTVHDAVLAALVDYPELQQQLRFVTTEGIGQPDEGDNLSEDEYESDDGLDSHVRHLGDINTTIDVNEQILIGDDTTKL